MTEQKTNNVFVIFLPQYISLVFGHYYGCNRNHQIYIYVYKNKEIQYCMSFKNKSEYEVSEMKRVEYEISLFISLLLTVQS